MLPVLSVQGSETPAESLNPAQQLTTSLPGSTHSLLPSLVTAVILFVRSGLLFYQTVFCTCDGVVIETKASGSLQDVLRNVNDVDHFMYSFLNHVFFGMS